MIGGDAGCHLPAVVRMTGREDIEEAVAAQIRNKKRGTGSKKKKLEKMRRRLSVRKSRHQGCLPWLIAEVTWKTQEGGNKSHRKA